jgi:hypothetical protein
VSKPQKNLQEKPKSDNRPQATTIQAVPKKTSRAALSRHQRKCAICRHPLREHIEREFLDWFSGSTIARDYQLNRRALYRHADALGLHERRANTIRFALGHILEQAANVEVTANSIISAVRVFTHLTDDGRWVNPPKEIIIRDERQDAVSNRQSLPIRTACNF